MQSLWNDADAAACRTDLELRAYTSRLLGRDKALVLHGGGNTSVKLRERNIVGEEEDILYVKGSGWDLETIQPAGFSPCRTAHLLKLAKLETMSDAQMAAELKNNMTNSGAPAPSVEAILHALLPFVWVDHTHSDAVVTLTNTPEGEALIRALYGDRLVIVPYVMPGFELAKMVAHEWPRQAHAGTIGMILMAHGIFAFGATARESYERMIELVDMAEKHIAQNTRPVAPSAPPVAQPQSPTVMADVRRAISDAAGAPMIVSFHADARSLAFAVRPDLEALTQQGPATPDHIIRTKRTAMLGRDVAGYVAAYKRYFATRGLREGDALAASRAAVPGLTMVDPAPRVALDPELGLIAAGRTPRDAAIAAEVYRHTMDIFESADALGGWRALPAPQLFDVEYWDLEQAKLRRAGAPAGFAGEIALVTGAASGIGKACVEALLKRGAAVVGVDLQPLEGLWASDPALLGVQCDITDEVGLREVLAKAAARFGGLDMLVLNAGMFGKTARIDGLATDAWRQVMRVNVDANLALMREAHPLLARSPRGGRVVVIGSKNVPAPGPGAAAYSASKAALTQLARVAALEWGADRIRVNVIHPNAVFDTGLWTEDVLKTRAASYGLSVQDYKTNNVLHVEVTSKDVAEMAAEMLGPLFAKTTGAQVPIDGGNERVI